MSDPQQFHSAWLEGAKAARAGQSSIHCKYGPDTYHFVTWHNGWASVKYDMTKEGKPMDKPAADQSKYDLDDV